MKTKTKIGLSLFALIASFAFFSFARAQTLKIGFVTDWEHGNQKKYAHKLPRNARTYLKKAVNYYNTAFKPDLAIGGGDYILSRNISKKKAQKDLRLISGIFKKINAQRLYCIGNHDLFKLSKNDVRKILEMENNYSFTDINGVRVVVLDTNDNAPSAGRVPDEEKTWLREILKTDLPVIVFSHHSPINTPYDPEEGEFRTNLFESGLIRSILEENGNVVAVFSGHHAINYSKEVHGINYLIINNLSDKKAQGTFATINVDKNEENIVSVRVNQFGKKPASYDFSKTITLNQE